MIKESPDFCATERPCKPLHVVLHEDLHGCAVDRACTLNCHAHTPTNGHMRAQENLRIATADLRFARISRHCRQSKTANRKPKIFSGANRVSSGFLRPHIQKVCTSASAIRLALSCPTAD